MPFPSSSRPKSRHFAANAGDLLDEVSAVPITEMCGLFQDKDSKALADAEAAGRNAFEELKQMAGGAAAESDLTPQQRRQRLLEDAAAGRVVAGREADWLKDRPKSLPAGQAVKQRGFLAYDRSALSPTVMLQELQSRCCCLDIYHIFY